MRFDSSMSLRIHLYVLVLASLCALSPGVGASASPPAGAAGNATLAAPYALDASHLTVQDVLGRFATDHGLTLRVDSSKQPGWQLGKLDGWVRADTGRAFLEHLAHAHRFSWFVANRTLHVSSAHDAAVERIALAGMRADSARSALEAVGIYDARFGWGELEGQDAVLVGGPRAYRALVRRVVASHAHPRSAEAAPETMIFPLRYAQAADKPPSSSSPAVRPGVATLLRELLAPSSAIAQPAFSLPAQPDMPPPLPSAVPSLAQWIGLPGGAAPLLGAPRARGAIVSPGSAPSPVSIVADEGTNAVMVWGDRSLRADIQRLIDALDRPSPLVSMDVLVIEADAATLLALRTAGERGEMASAANRASNPASFETQLAQAVADQRVRLLNHQTLVGRMNAHATLTIGAESSHRGAADDKAEALPVNGRDGSQGDRLDLAARIVPAAAAGTTAIVVDVDLLMAQPTGLPGQTWTNTSSVKFDAAVTLESGAPPRLIASYPVATARAEQRAIFISAQAL